MIEEIESLYKSSNVPIPRIHELLKSAKRKVKSQLRATGTPRYWQMVRTELVRLVEQDADLAELNGMTPSMVMPPPKTPPKRRTRKK